MTRSRFFIWAIIFLFSATANAESILWQQTKIPMSEAGPNGLETLLVWPNSPGKHPLALLSHGSPRDTQKRAEMTAISFLPIAMEFARRGFAVAVVLRRGYGNSGGGWAESYGDCYATNYKRAAFESAKDLHAAIQYLATLPQFDIDRMIAVGVSAGGFATIALTADSPPKGLVAAINFAGGRGSTAHDSVCQEDALVATFGLLGKKSRIPMLWIYAKNDHFFNPAAARDFLKAFNANGGNATLIEAPAFATEGHTLFSSAGMPIWLPMVDTFLKSQHLVLLNDLLPLPAMTYLQPPAHLSFAGKKDFLTYLDSAPHKAFAVDSDGAYAWRSGRYSIDEAKSMALTACQQQYTTLRCKLYAVDNEYVNGYF